MYAIEELEESICPWCIADGSAAERYDAVFTDAATAPSGIAEQILDTLEKRTPGFAGWQQERWLYHCQDAAVFLGAVGWEDLENLRDAQDCLRREHAPGLGDDEMERYLHVLTRNGSPTGYLFQCLHCGMHLAYSDSD